MNRRAVIGRADLLRLLHVSPESAAARLATLCGFEQEGREEAPPPALPVISDGARPVVLESRAPKPQAALTNFTYLRATRFETLEPPPLPPAVLPFSRAELSSDPTFRSPDPAPLMPHARLLPYLRRAFGHARPTQHIDERRLLSIAERLEPIRAIPLRRVTAWPTAIRILADRRPAMAGFAADVRVLRRRLASAIGRDRCPIGYLQDGVPVPSVPTLVVSDLGCLDGDRTQIDVWSRPTQRARAARDSYTLLLPCPRSRWDRSSLNGLRAICWDRTERLPAGRGGQRPTAPVDAAQREMQVAALLARVAPALHVEPGLLRAARIAPGDTFLDVGVEYDAHMHPDVPPHVDTFAIAPAKVNAYRRAFRDLGAETKAAVADAIRVRHSGYSIAFRLEETLNLVDAGACQSDDTCTTADDPTALDEPTAREARSRLRAALEQAVFDGDAEGLKQELSDWIGRSVSRTSEEARGSTEMALGWVLADYVRSGDVPETFPAGLDQHAAAAMVERLAKLQRDDLLEEDILLRLGQGPGEIEVRPWSPDVDAGESRRGTAFPVAYLTGRRIASSHSDESGSVSTSLHLLKASDTVVQVQVNKPKKLVVETNTARVELAPWNIPAWASAAGCDEYGDYIETEVNGVVFQFRWIPPGTFVMGSPDNEEGRWDDEGPRHPVTISRGFWLGATPCTQAQWEAVMAANPSQFKGADHPVENVSWDDCREFHTRLNALTPGLNARLPSEAEWEYACRAGTISSYNDGSACTNLAGEDPALDRLGWYSKNSERATQPCARKSPNSWGLYDMHGNVLEWCLDAWASYDAEPQIDPSRQGERVGRVCRGGGWSDAAGGCRSACRDRVGPGGRDNSLGFPLARRSGPGAGVAEERGRERGARAAGRGPDRRAEGEKEWGREAMTFGFWWIPARQSEEAERRLNEAMQSRRVVSVTHHFCASPDPGWAICVEFTGPDEGAPGDRRKARAVDYREVLDEPTFRLYSALRQVRKEMAEQEGVPPYVVVTNEQLAAIAERRCASAADLGSIAGFGPSRAQKYGRRFLECIQTVLTGLTNVEEA